MYLSVFEWVADNERQLVRVITDLVLLEIITIVIKVSIVIIVL